jgi:uncharacterized Zn ribbon protein
VTKCRHCGKGTVYAMGDDLVCSKCGKDWDDGN